MIRRKRMFRLSLAAMVLVLLAAGCAGGDESVPEEGALPEGEMPTEGGVSSGNTVEPTVSFSPQQGPTGSQVQITASGFPADTAVEIGFGPPQSEYEVTSQARTDAQGRLTTTVEVPSWAEDGRPYVFVVAERGNQPNLPKAVSDPFTVTSGN